MRKFIGLLLLLVIVTGCTKDQNWMYSLPNEYAIDRSNVETIQLVKEENGEKEVVVSQYITGFALLNDRYVYLQTARNYTNDEDTSTVIVLYYLVDSETDAVTGPFTLDNRDVILENIGVTEAPTLIQTGSMPEGATIY